MRSCSRASYEPQCFTALCMVPLFAHRPKFGQQQQQEHFHPQLRDLCCGHAAKLLCNLHLSDRLYMLTLHVQSLYIIEAATVTQCQIILGNSLIFLSVSELTPLPNASQMEGSSSSSSQAPKRSEDVYTAAGPEGLALLAAARMRCGGCGAKVGATALTRALQQLKQHMQEQHHQQTAMQHQDASDCHHHHHQPQQQQQQQGLPLSPADLLPSLDAPDDAALLPAPPPGHLLLQTVDFFRSFVSDPHVFGAIAANHALGR